MSKYVEKRLGFVDILNCREQNDLAKPFYEGKIKVKASGKECYIKLWKKPKPGITGNVMYTGYFYELVEE